jgi:pimeloyl-ACP methyl ester carboxylesterase
MIDGVENVRLTANGIELHATIAGPAHGPLVILLHGFPEFWYGWRHQIGPLAAAGLRLTAPDQRGYNLSDKPAGIAAYRVDNLADDVLGLADALGCKRFAVVGHDWGGVVAWHLAGRNPDRVTRAAILNAPHPATLWRHARRHPAQLRKSWYVAFFQMPLVPELGLRTADFFMLRRTLRRTSHRDSPEHSRQLSTGTGRCGTMPARSRRPESGSRCASSGATAMPFSTAVLPRLAPRCATRQKLFAYQVRRIGCTTRTPTR